MSSRRPRGERSRWCSARLRATRAAPRSCFGVSYKIAAGQAQGTPDRLARAARSAANSDRRQRLPELFCGHIGRRPSSRRYPSAARSGAVPATTFLSRPIASNKLCGRQIADRRQRSHLRDQRGQRITVGGRERAARDAELGGDEHPVGNGLSMAEPAVFRYGFERMSGGVPEVQRASRPRFALVLVHDFRLDAAGFRDHRYQRRGSRAKSVGRSCDDAIEERAARDHAVLDRLRRVPRGTHAAGASRAAAGRPRTASG